MEDILFSQLGDSTSQKKLLMINFIRSLHELKALEMIMSYPLPNLPLKLICGY
jgi:hypothetical protein